MFGLPVDTAAINPYPLIKPPPPLVFPGREAAGKFCSVFYSISPAF